MASGEAAAIPQTLLEQADQAKISAELRRLDVVKETVRAILMRDGRAKPYIQRIGEHGIPIRDELDLCGARGQVEVWSALHR
jgi:hypothetical protein